MDVLNRTLLAALAVAGVTMIGEAAQAASIGFSVTAANTMTNDAIPVVNNTIAPATTLLATDVAGLPAIAHANWNNISGTLDYLKPGAPSTDGYQHNYPNWESAINNSLATVVDSTGTTVSGASVSWSFNKSWWNQPAAGWWFGRGRDTGSTPGNITLQAGAVMGSPTTITVTGVPYSNYDVYAYLNGGGNPGGALGAIDGTFTLAASGTGTVNTTPQPYYWDWPATNVTWTQGLDYVVIPGNTASGFTLNFVNNNGTGITGFQVVQVVPEPTSIGLLGLGSLALLGRRRARKA